MKNDPVSGPSAFDDGEESGSSLELRGLFHFCLRFLWLVLLVAAAVGTLVYFYLRKQPAKYESRTVIQVELENTRQIAGASAEQIDYRDPMLMETVIQSFRNRSLLEGVVRRLDLTNSPTFLGRTEQVPAPLDEAIERLDGSLKVANRIKTLFVDISFRHSDPLLTKQVTAGLVDEFITQNSEQQLHVAQEQTEVLKRKAVELQAKLERSAAKVQAYKNQAETVSLDAGRNLQEAKLTDLNNSLSTARNERLKLEGDLRMLQNVPDRDAKALLQIASVGSDLEVVAAQTKVRALESDINSLSDRYRAKHPRMIEAQSRLENARQVEVATVKTAPDRLAARYAAAQTAEGTLEKAASTQERDLLKLDEVIMPYRALQGELENDRKLFDEVQQRLKQSSAMTDVHPVNFRIAEPASTAYPLPDRKPIFTAASTLLAALVVLGLLAAIFVLDSSIHTVDEAERLLALPVLSAVPKLQKVKAPTELLTLLDRPDSPVAESYRSLRTALSLLGAEDKRKVLLFTSAVQGEGKTLTAANTALALAQQGLRTVLLDADLRRPSVAKMFLDLKKPRPGIAEFLVEQPLQKQSCEIPNLTVITAGERAPNPAELLANGRFALLVEQLKGEYDRIVVDTAPVNVVSDTLSIVGCATSLVLVVRNGRTPRQAVRRALELLRRAGVRPDGLVLNCVPKWSGLGHYYYYSSNDKYGGEGTYGKGYPPNDAPLPSAT